MLNTEVTKELVEEKKPDAVILATGGKQLVPSIKGIDKENVFLAHDVLEGIKKVGRNVLIAGAGLVGLETADFLRERGGRTSTLIDMIPAVNYGILGVGTHLKARLDSIGTQYIMGAKSKNLQIRELYTSRTEKRKLQMDMTVSLLQWEQKLIIHWKKNSKESFRRYM